MKKFLFGIVVFFILSAMIGKEVVIGLLFISFVIYLLNKKQKSNNKNSSSDFYIKTFDSEQEIQNANIRWIPKDKSFKVGKHIISSGYVYVYKQKNPLEGAAINTALPIRNSNGNEEPIGYFPQYYILSPTQRDDYLAWLESNRTDYHPEHRDFGHLFLFFYGAERRLLIDGDNDIGIVNELIRIMHTYEPYARSGSLRHYFSNLILFWAWKQDINTLNSVMNDLVPKIFASINDGTLSVLLAYYYKSDKTLPLELAYAIASKAPNSRRSVVIKRVNKEFRKLFEKRYSEEYPKGFKLKCSKRNTYFEYQFASPGISQRYAKSIQIPNVLGINSQFKTLTKIWNSCIEDLTSYSKELLKSTENVSMKALLNLPQELMQNKENPLQKTWLELLKGSELEKDYYLVYISSIAKMLGVAPRDTLTLKQSKDIATAVQSLGFCIVPDARYTSGAYKWHQYVGIFPSIESEIAEPASDYLAISAMLQLCVFIAMADGDICQEEMDILTDFISSKIVLSENDSKRLTILENILIENPALSKLSVSKIACRIPTSKRNLIIRVLIEVACADGIITKDENKALKKISKAFEVQESELNKLITTFIQEVGGNIIIEGKERKPHKTETPTTITSSAPNQPFALNKSLLDKIANDTKEIISVLGEVMSEPEEIITSKQEEIQIPIQESKEVEIPDWFVMLDSKYHPFTEKILSYPAISKDDFEQLAKQFHLMPIGAYDAINEWADEALEISY